MFQQQEKEKELYPEQQQYTEQYEQFNQTDTIPEQ